MRCPSPRTHVPRNTIAVRPAPQPANGRLAERSASLLQLLDINSSEAPWHGQDLRCVVPDAGEKPINLRSTMQRRRSSFLKNMGECVCMSSTLERGSTRPLEPAPWEPRDRRRSSMPFVDDGSMPPPDAFEPLAPSPTSSASPSRRPSERLPVLRGASFVLHPPHSLGEDDGPVRVPPVPAQAQTQTASQSQGQDSLRLLHHPAPLAPTPKQAVAAVNTTPELQPDDAEAEELIDGYDPELTRLGSPDHLNMDEDMTSNSPSPVQSPLRRRRASREPSQDTILEIAHHIGTTVSADQRRSPLAMTVSPMASAAGSPRASPVPPRPLQRTSSSIDTTGAAVLGAAMGSVATVLFIKAFRT